MKKPMNRRDFGRMCAGFAASAAAVPISTTWAEDLPQLDPAGPQASALGYTPDVATVDTAKFANFVEGSSCANCMQYLGGDEWGKCNIFPGSVVNVNGWCSVFVKKPA